jgi:hypothetical protein
MHVILYAVYAQLNVAFALCRGEVSLNASRRCGAEVTLCLSPDFVDPRKERVVVSHLVGVRRFTKNGKPLLAERLSDATQEIKITLKSKWREETCQKKGDSTIFKPRLP